MSDERIRVLEMFKEGKLSMEETLELLEALEDMVYESDPKYPELEISDNDIDNNDDTYGEAIDNEATYNEDNNTLMTTSLKEKRGSQDKNEINGSGQKFKFKMPKFVIPRINIPEIKIPEIKIPEINIPPINIPEVDLTSSSHRQGSNYDNISINSIGKYDGEVRADRIAISGMGNFTGNVFADKISISGVGEFLQDVRTDKLILSGKAKTGGILRADQISITGLGDFCSNVEADKMTISGKVTINGSLSCDTVSNSGDFHIDGDISVDNISVSGNCHVGHNINADNIKLSGYLKTGGDVCTDSFESKGSFDIECSLKADSINIELNNNCRVKDDIIADSIIVISGRSGNDTSLEATSMQADIVELVNTRLIVLRGHDIKVGAGCEINKVEYTGELVVMEGAKVRQQVKVDVFE